MSAITVRGRPTWKKKTHENKKDKERRENEPRSRLQQGRPGRSDGIGEQSGNHQPFPCLDKLFPDIPATTEKKSRKYSDLFLFWCAALLFFSSCWRREGLLVSQLAKSLAFFGHKILDKSCSAGPGLVCIKAKYMHDLPSMVFRGSFIFAEYWSAKNGFFGMD